MREVKTGDKTIALVIDGSAGDGTVPLTDEKWPLQVISLKHPKGKKLVAHFHKPTDRKTDRLMEALIVTSGKIEATIYFEDKPVEKLELASGQGVILVNAGIGIEVLEDAQMMEFKNGPFVEDKVVIS